MGPQHRWWGSKRTAQNPEWRIIDLLKMKEFHYAAPMYTHAAATLVASGNDRTPEMLDSAMRTLDVTTGDLASLASMKRSERKLSPGSNSNCVDFYIRPVMGAYLALQGIAPSERIAAWKNHLSAIDPMNTYSFPEGNDFNWTLCLLWGEFLRHRQGCQPNSAIDHTLNIPRWHTTPLGLSFEMHSPWAYDGFGRYCVVGMLAGGYQGSELDFWRDAAWLGAWSSLLVQAPNGEIPLGGRSAQHFWLEPKSASIWERYASAYAQAGRLQEAGMFKRAAHLALRETNRWIDDQGQPQITKNWFPPQDRHGYMGYSQYGAYGPQTASMLSSAWEAAVDSIPERAAPADVGGILVQVPELNSVIAHADGAYIHYLTRGDQARDPTGLARVHLRGAHPQLGPSCGAVAEQGDTAKTKAPKALTKTSWGIGPIWTAADGAQVRLATVNDPSLRLINSQVAANAVSFVTLAEITGPGGPHRVEETIVLAGNQVRVSNRCTTAAAGPLAVSYPTLTTDGRNATIITVDGKRAELRHPDAGGNRSRDYLARRRQHHPQRPLH